MDLKRSIESSSALSAAESRQRFFHNDVKQIKKSKTKTKNPKTKRGGGEGGQVKDKEKAHLGFGSEHCQLLNRYTKETLRERE